MRTLRNGRKRWQLFIDYEGKCAICGGLLGGDFQIDHRIPYKITGCSDLVNLQPVHPTCNRRKGSQMYVEDTIKRLETSIDALMPGYYVGTRTRPGSHYIVRSVWQDICDGKTLISFEVPPRYGKTDIARALAVIAKRSGLSPYTLVVTPARYLRRQAKKEKDLNQFATRYGVSDFIVDELTSLPKKTLFKPDKRAYLLAATLQMFVGEDAGKQDDPESLGNRAVIRNAAAAIKESGQRLLIIADECHLMAEGKAFGQVLKEFHKAGAIVVSMTGTFMRSDDGMIIGANTSRLKDGLTEKRYVRHEKEDGERVIQEWEDTKNILMHEPTYRVPLSDAWDQGVLCKIDFKQCDISGDRWDTEGKVKVRLSEMPAWQAEQHLNRVIRSEGMIEGCLRMFVSALLTYKKVDDRFQGMIFAANNNDKFDRGTDNNHCNLILTILNDILIEQGIKWDVRIVTGDDDQAAQSLESFREQGFDGLIVKQMGGVGLDVNWLKVICDLSNIRTLAAWIQRMLRGATMHDVAKVCVVISPADIVAENNYEIIKQNGGGYTAEEITKSVFIIDHPVKPGPESKEIILWGSGEWSATIDENMNVLRDRVMYRFVNNIMTELPLLRTQFSETTLAERFNGHLKEAGATLTVDEDHAVSRDLSKARAKNQDDFNEIVGRIIGLHRRNGLPNNAVSDKYAEETNLIKIRAGVPTSTAISHLHDDDGAWGRLLRAANDRHWEVKGVAS